MSKEIYISSTPHETRLAIVENDDLTEIYYERENEYTLAGSIYNGRVTRVLPGMQSSFVDIGLERDAFLYITDFMEEAGEAADFDSSTGHRSPQLESPQRDRETRPSDRGQTARSPEREGLAPSALSGDSSAEPYAGRSPERQGGRDRNGRGGRNRRGGRDRTRQQLPTEPAVSTTPDFVQQSFAAPADVRSEPELKAADHEDVELGEEANGADGSRRWRGRRGRRGRRVPEQAGEASLAAGPVSPDEDFSAEEGMRFSLEAGSESHNEAPPAEFSVPPADLSRESSRAPSESGEGRGRRGPDDRGRNRRGGRERQDRAPRAPRGFAPRTSLYGVENSPAYGEAVPPSAAPVEPILLPGEVLSKYRKPEEGSQSTSLPLAPAAQSSAAEFKLPTGWDGGAILPGETLSRHRQPPAPRTENAVSRTPTAARTASSGTRANSSARSTFDSQPGSAPETLRPTSPLPSPDAREKMERVASPEPVPFRAMEPKPQAPTDYEPTAASASYRVDPAPPSEFRQAAPIQEEAFLPVEPEAPSSSLAHSITPQPEDPATFASAPVELQSTLATSSDSVASPTSEDITLVGPSGEMVSSPAESSADAGPDSPMAHEGALLDSSAREITNSPTQALHETAEFEDRQSLEEEEYSTTLHASSIEEMDDLDEEETLEGAADLGTMLREMSIDQITRPAGDQEVDDLDEMEEDDSLEDQEIYSFDEQEDSSGEIDESDTEEDVLHETLSRERDSQERSGGDSGASPIGSPSRDRAAAAHVDQGDPERRRGRRDGRRDSRRDGRSRSAGGSGDRERSGGRSSRHSMQATNLPAISDLLKPGQEVLVQIAKEPIAKKGARITSHIALPGRFLVFMPTVNHTGVSRKIESDSERRRLKEILLSEKGEASGGFIVRTAASGASEEELRSDLRFLLNLWADIKQRSESSKSPALIYHDLNLVERILRDQVTDNFSAIWVDTETDYERILRFLQRFQPTLIRRVKLYSKETPLFEQFGITEEINKALRSKVWLKSGGSIVINQTEALVAIDINTGKYVGKTARLEDTIVKTNLDAIPEIVRQIRLRDLGGIIIIDFIDMDERKNRNRVMTALEDELRKDRAPSKVLQFNDFGLVAITRKRVKQSLERTLSTTCGVCQGTGMVKSPVTVCNDIFIEIRKMHKHLDRGDVMLRVHPDVVKQLKSSTKWLQEMEEMAGKTILVKSDPSLHPEQFDIH